MYSDRSAGEAARQGEPTRPRAWEDGAVTVRDRDSMSQERVPVEGVKRLILDRMEAAREG